MYKLLLCWRYLLTRYLAMACIVSVMLGVATLIVVNSVMSGFSTKLKDRLHGLLSDIVVEAPSYDGFPDPEGKMAAIRSDPFLDERIEAMTATMEVFAMLQFQVNGHTITRPVHLIGIDPEGRARIGGFAEHLVRQKNSAKPSFDLTAEGKRHNYEINHRPRLVWDNFPQPVQSNPDPREPPPPDPPPSTPHVPRGVILGFALGHVRQTNPDTGKPEDVPILQEGDEVVLTTLSGQRLAPVFDRFTVCDFIKTEMSDYDANYVFMPLDHLQHLRTTEGRVTSIQVRLKERKDAEAVQRRLQALFPAPAYNVLRWEQKQGAILAAISIEKGLLNVLLFLIIAVAGFGILAIFSMIVSEKTKDIGILKALGASNRGVMSIFLGYGLLLGLVGAVFGTGLGLSITVWINNIEKGLTALTGQEIFDRSVYYFSEIPTDIQPGAVLLVNLGALLIAVLFSVLPALRAAMLHPVRALRYE